MVYYGEEIGMVDADISYEDTMDPWGCNCGPINYANCSRDPARTPMQWSQNKNAGFSQVRKLLQSLKDFFNSSFSNKTFLNVC